MHGRRVEEAKKLRARQPVRDAQVRIRIRPWQVRALTPNSATLVLTHRPCASWPFALEAQQHIVLGAHTLTIEMSAPNLEKDAVPLAFGHHPYFRREGPG